MSGALEASIGSTGRPTSSPISAQRGLALRRQRCHRHPWRPASIAARRTAASGTSAAAAIASWTSASSAPCRTAPVTTPRSQACSASVARPKRSTTAALPGGLGAGAGEGRNRVEVLVHLEDGEARGVGWLRHVADAAPAEPGATLPQRAGEVGRHGLDLLRAARASASASAATLAFRRAPSGSRRSRGRGHDVGEEHTAQLPIRVRTSNSSGKNVRSKARRRKPTPDDPPVPLF